jgi:hypothetical protein
LQKEPCWFNQSINQCHICSNEILREFMLLGLNAWPIQWKSSFFKTAVSSLMRARQQLRQQAWFTGGKQACVATNDMLAALLLPPPLLLLLVLLCTDVQYSLGQAGVGAAGCLMCVVWLLTALALGRKHKQLAGVGAALKS